MCIVLHTYCNALFNSLNIIKMEYQTEQSNTRKIITLSTSLCNTSNNLPIHIQKHHNHISVDDDHDTDGTDDTDDSIVTPMYDQLSEDEIIEVENTMLMWLNDYLETHVPEMSSPTFYQTMIDYITQLLYDDWIHMELCVEDNYDDIHHWVTQMASIIHLQSHIPPREIVGDDIDIYLSSKLPEQISLHLSVLLSVPQPKQKSAEWYEFRHNILTASNVWKVFSTPSQYNSLVYEKCRPYQMDEHLEGMGWKHPTSTNAMHWGVRYEPVSIAIYCSLNQTCVGEFGCIVHPTIPYLAASPDGINIDANNDKLYGRMIEVKNIVNREITGVPLEHYWIQMQVQMEVCNLNECDFIETRFKEFETEIDFYSWTASQKGVILYFLPKPRFGMVFGNGSDDGHYVYMPIDHPTDMMSVEQWIQRQKLERPEENCIHTTYWYLDQYSCVFVPRNRAWFSSVLPQITDCWRTIERERMEGYEHRAPMKKTPKILEIHVTSDVSNETHYIENMPQMGGTCVVKIGGN